MLPTVYKKFLKRIADNGVCMYLWVIFEGGGCVDIDIDDLEHYLDNPKKFWEDYREEK